MINTAFSETPLKYSNYKTNYKHTILGAHVFRKSYDPQFYLWVWASKFKHYCFIKDGSNVIEIKSFEIILHAYNVITIYF